MRLGLVVNPAAGRGRAARRAEVLRDALCRAGFPDPAVVHTQGRGGGQAAAARLAEDGVDLVVVVGGDGTVSEAVQTLAGGDVPLAVFPGGTGNDWARSLGWPFHAREWPSLLRGGRRRSLDLLRDSDGLYVVNSAGVGLSGLVGLRERKFRRLGRWGYTVAVVMLLLRHSATPMTVVYPGGRWEVRAHLVEVGNGPTSGGGIPMTPRAELDDGLLDVCVVESLPALQRLSLMRRAYAGRHLGRPGVRYGRWPWVEIRSPAPLWAHVDGESRRVNNLRLEVAPGLLEVWTP